MSVRTEIVLRPTKPHDLGPGGKPHRLEFIKRYDDKHSSANVEHLTDEELDELYRVIGLYTYQRFIDAAKQLGLALSTLGEDGE